MTRAKPKSKAKAPKTKAPGFDGKGNPKPEAAHAPHRLPGQPIGFNLSQDWSTYDPGFHPDDFVKHCQEGNTKREICAAWGIGLTTLSSWAEKYPDMKDAFEKGKAAQQAWLLSRAKKAAFQDSRANNGTLVIFLLKNICAFGDTPKTDFDDVQDVELDFVYGESKPGA